MGYGPRRIPHLVLERAVAVAQQYRHVVGAAVSDGQVGAAVAGEVPRHEGVWRVPRRVSHLVLEGAVALAQQDRHVVGAVVGDSQVGAAVAGEVPRHEGAWVGPYLERLLWLEGAVAVAQQHRHIVGAEVGDGQVGAAVVGEVPRHDRGGPGPHRVRHLVLEGAVAVAQQHRHVVGFVVGDDQVGAAVAGEIPRYDRAWRRSHRDRLKQRGGWRQCGRQGVGARAAEVFHLEIVGPRRDMQVDLVVRVAGRLAVALHEDLALGVPQRKPRGDARGVDLRHQTPVGVRVDLEEGDFARGERAGLGGAQRDLGGDGGEDVARRTRQQGALFELSHARPAAAPGPPGSAVRGRSKGNGGR